jgi:gliding motility-associated-like protein
MKKLLTVFIILAIHNLHAQLETHRWYFTNTTTRGITFDFTTGVPVNTSEHVNPYAIEGTGVANNPITGALMFYVTTNQVRDKLHAVMPNGSAITNHASSAQKGIICPKPGNCNQFYIFQNTSAREVAPGSFYYSLVDMSLPGNGTIITPRGDIVAGQKNIFLKNNTGEATCLIKSTSTDVYWLIISTFDVNELYVYRIDSSGVSLSSNYNVPIAIDDYRQFNYSYQSQKFILTSGTELDPTLLFDFNRTTGTITGYSTVPGTPLGANPNYWTGMIGSEWSADGTKLYIGKYRWFSGITGGGVYQYDLNLPFNPIQNVFMNGGGYNNVMLDLKRAPNGEIYFIYDHPTFSFRYLGKINNPNNAGVACNVIPLGHDLGFNVGVHAKFPFHIQPNEKPVALNDTILFSCADSIANNINILGNDFDLDDNKFTLLVYNIPPGVIVTTNPDLTVNLQTDSIPAAGYSIPYTICDLKCFSKCDTAYLIIQPDFVGIEDFLSSPVQLCPNDTVSLIPSTSGNNYLWSTGATTQSIDVDTAGIYSLQISNGSCIIHDSTIVVDENSTNVILGTDLLLCNNPGPVSVPFSTSSTWTTILWSTNDTTTSISVDSSAIYWVTLTSACGTATDSIYVGFLASPIATLGSDPTVCPGDTVTISVSAGSNSIQWSTSDTTNSIDIVNPGSYWVEVSNVCGTEADTIILINIFPPLANLGNDSIICNGNPFIISSSWPGADILWSSGDTVPNINIDTSGIYWVSLSNNCGSDGDSIQFIFELNPSVNLGTDPVICNGDSALLTVVSSESTIVWSTGDTTNSILVNSGGIYWVAITNDCASDADTVIVSANTIPIANLGNDTTFCNTASIPLTASWPGSSVLWSNADTSASISVNTSGTYWVLISNGCGNDIDSVNIILNNQPFIDLGPDTTFCSGSPILLNALSPGSSVIWNTSDTTQTILANSSGNYWVNVSNYCGTDADTINLSIVAAPNVNLGPDIDQCNGQIYNLSIPSQSASILWSNTETDTSIIIATSGVYWVIVSNGCGTVSDSVIFNFYAVPDIDLGPNITLCQDDTAHLSATWPGASYIWSTGSTNQQISVISTGTYWVNVTNLCGSDNDTASIDYIPALTNLILPNVITPDGNGVNDEYIVAALIDAQSFNMDFFDRWGVLIYSTNNVNDPWPGTTETGNPVPEGTYYVILQYTNCDGSTVTKTQFITVFY